LVVNTEFSKGGDAKIFRTLYQSLNEKKKITRYFAYNRGKGLEKEKIYKFGFCPEIYF